MALREMSELQDLAGQLASGEEPVFRVLIGDLMPRPDLLRWLSTFFASRERTRLHVEYGAVDGPIERLIEGQVDLIFHRVPAGDPRFESIALMETQLVPVAAPGYLPNVEGELGPADMRSLTQCVIRDTAAAETGDYFLVEGAQRCSVPDQHMKKEFILNGIAWGHLPSWLIGKDLDAGRLVKVDSRFFQGRSETVAAVRMKGEREVEGPVARSIWTAIQEDAVLRKALLGHCE